MNGLEISRRFCADWFLPFIDREMPGLRSRIAVGRFAGSDAIGADDHLSRDHGWGPTLEVYLDDGCDADDAARLARTTAAAPVEFCGARRQGGHDTAITLRRTRDWLEATLGAKAGTPGEWLCCAARLETIESPLYFLRHGALFHDGSGQFTAIRARYRHYPDDIHRLRLAQCLHDIAHYGEYNFVWRLVERGDVVAMQMALGHFSAAVMRLHFYLERDFAPYWKWLPHEFRARGYAPAIHEQLVALPRLAPNAQSAAVLAICDQLRERLVRDAVVPGPIENPYGIPWFFQFREAVVRTIGDPEIRRLTY